MPLRLVPILLLFMAACRSEPTSPPPAASKNTSAAPIGTYQLQNEPDSVKLRLNRQLSLGTPYDALRNRYRGLGPLQNEPVAGLSHAHLPVRVMGVPMQLRFSFEQNLLYSYRYEAESVACRVADEMYRNLRTFYTGEFGSPREEPLEDGPDAAIVSYWSTPQREDVVLTRGRRGNVCRVAFGFQKQ